MKLIGTGLVVLGLAISAAASAGEAPATISPGELSRIVTIDSRCPTFSFGEVPDARQYELVVYRLEAHGDESPALLRDLPGSVETFTPSLDSCLEAGARYAWSVRARLGESMTEWSQPRVFEVARRREIEDLAEALAVVRRFLDEGGSLDPAENAAGNSTPEDPETDGNDETDAVAVGTPPAGAGAAALNVAGSVMASSFTGDGSGLSNLPAATNVVCSSCISSSDVQSNSLTGFDIQNGSIYSTDIANATISAVDIASGAVKGAEIDTIRIVYVECNGDCGDLTLSQACGSGYEPLFVDCADVQDYQGDNCGTNNKCLRTTVTGSSSVFNYCDDVSGNDANVFCISTN